MFEACPKCNGRKTVEEACTYCGTPDKKKPAAKKKRKRGPRGRFVEA